MVLRVGRQRCLWCALVEQSPLKNRVHVGGVRRLHRSAERHRRGRSAEPPLRGVMAMFEGHNHRTVTRVVQGLAALAACHRVRVASPGALQRLGWHNEGGAPGFKPAHQPLHRAGDAGGHDLKTTSWLRHTSSIHDPASAWNAPCPCKIMQRAGTAATARFWRD